MAAQDAQAPTLHVAEVVDKDVVDGAVVSVSHPGVTAHEVSVVVRGVGGGQSVALSIGKVVAGYLSNSIEQVSESGELTAQGDGSLPFTFSALEAGTKFMVTGTVHSGSTAAPLPAVEVQTLAVVDHQAAIIDTLQRQLRVARHSSAPPAATPSAVAALRDELSAANARLESVEARARREESAKQEAEAAKDSALAGQAKAVADAKVMFKKLQDAVGQMKELKESRKQVTTTLADLVSAGASQDEPVDVLLQRLTEQTASLRAELQASQQRCQDAEEALAHGVSDGEGNARLLQDAREALDATQAELVECKAALQKAEGAIAEMKATVEAVTVAGAEAAEVLKAKVTALEEEVESRALEAAAAREEVAVAREEAAVASDEAAAAREEVASLQAQAGAQSSAAAAEVGDLKEQMAALREEGEVVQSHLAGVMAELGVEVPQGNTLALVTALQQGLAVVRDTAAAPAETAPASAPPSPGLLVAMQRLRDDRDGLQEALEKEQGARAALKGEFEGSKKDCAEAQAEVGRCKALIARLEGEAVDVAVSNSRADGLEREVVRLQGEVDDYAAKLHRAQREVVGLNEALEEERSLTASVTERSEQVEKRLAEVLATAEAERVQGDEITALKAQVTRLQSEVAAAEGQLAAAEAEHQEMLGQMQSGHVALQQQLAVVTEELAGLKAAAGGVDESAYAEAFKREVQAAAAADGRVDASSVQNLCLMTTRDIATVIRTLHKCGGNQAEVVHTLVPPTPAATGAPMSGGGTGGR